MSEQCQVAVVYHSGYGHTAKQAQAVYAGVQEVSNTQGYLCPVEDIEKYWSNLQNCTAIIFGCPTYMGSVSAGFKGFMEACSREVWMKQCWLNKLAGGFTNSASLNGDKFCSLMQIQTFACQLGMLWVPLGIMPGNQTSKGSNEDLNRLGSSTGAMAQSCADLSPEQSPPPADLKTAHLYGKRIAQLACLWPKVVPQISLS